MISFLRFSTSARNRFPFGDFEAQYRHYKDLFVYQQFANTMSKHISTEHGDRYSYCRYIPPDPSRVAKSMAAYGTGPRRPGPGSTKLAIPRRRTLGWIRAVTVLRSRINRSSQNSFQRKCTCPFPVSRRTPERIRDEHFPILRPRAVGQPHYLCRQSQTDADRRGAWTRGFRRLATQQGGQRRQRAGSRAPVYPAHPRGEPPGALRPCGRRRKFRHTRRVPLVATLIRRTFSPRQLFERMVEFWSDHFSVPANDLPVALSKFPEDRCLIRKRAMGTFEALNSAGHAPFGWPAPTGDPDRRGYWQSANGLVVRFNSAAA